MLDNDELVIGLVAPLGIDLDGVYTTMDQALTAFDYRCVKVSLSAFLSSHTKLFKGATAPQPVDEYIRSHQDAGNELRKSVEHDALARAALLEIHKSRQVLRDSKYPSLRIAYIVRQLKTPEEAALLRRVYGERFVLIGVFATADQRIQWLAKRISISRGDGSAWTKHEGRARELIRRDDAEEEVRHGQNVRHTFPESDLFVTWEGDEESTLAEHRSFKGQFDRFLTGLFGYHACTPTTDEFLMYQARAVALRSGDWSRQVGAVIATEGGSVIAVGRNDDPKVGGGLLSTREFEQLASGFKHETVSELMEALSDWIKPELMTMGAGKLAADAISTKLKDTRLMGMGEFGRMVHAEMAAITDAAARGVAVAGQALYCTTYPCQNCAKHLISSGIKVLVHIDPYPKSLVREMYGNEIDHVGMRPLGSPEFQEQNAAHSGKMLFCTYIGVAPRSYVRLFSMSQRKKKDGTPIAWDRRSARPRLSTAIDVSAYEALELTEGRRIASLLKDVSHWGLA
jgi:deoxycytidylate deaminase